MTPSNLSIIVPAYNEEKNIPIFFNRLKTCLNDMGVKKWEVIFIDDGSTDGTYSVMKNIKSKNKRLIKFYNNYGKSSALDAGFKHAKYDIVITMDADLQDDPKEIPKFVSRINKGFDVVSGWKFKRKDPLSKIIPSKIFNSLASLFTGVKIHDFNCGFKAYRKIVCKNISLYGDLHRYVPVLAASKGFKVTEIKVRHHKRKYGESKYGFSRLSKGAFDLVTTTFFMKYSKNPLHFFGLLGFISFFLGFLGGLFIIFLKLQGNSVGDRPLLFLIMLLLVVGIQFVSLGLLAEIMIRDKERDFYIIEESE
ncbi:MAG: glycosyltransferase family 2 protein [Nanobdellota archaeon]